MRPSPKNLETPTWPPHPPKIKQPFLPKDSLQFKIHLGSLKTFSTQIFGHDRSTGRNEGHRGVQSGKVVTFFTHISSIQVLESADKDASISCGFSVYKVYSLTLLEFKSRSLPCDVNFLAAEIWLFFPQSFWICGLKYKYILCPLMNKITLHQNIAKGTTDPRVEFISQILIKLQLQNLAWTSTSNSWPNLVLKVWTKV